LKTFVNFIVLVFPVLKRFSICYIFIVYKLFVLVLRRRVAQIQSLKTASGIGIAFRPTIQVATRPRTMFLLREHQQKFKVCFI